MPFPQQSKQSGSMMAEDDDAGSPLSAEGQAGMAGILGDSGMALMGQSPMVAGNPAAAPSGGSMPSAPPQTSSAIAQGGSAPGSNPMIQARDQFQTMIAQIQGLTQMYPMAEQELSMMAQLGLAAMVKIAQGVQPDAMAPGVGV